MKHIPTFLFIFLVTSISAGEPNTHAEQVQHIEQQGKQLINTLFDNAKSSVAAKELLMDEQWLSKQPHIKELQNLLSDSHIASFDENTKNPVPMILSTYVIDKVNKEIPHIYAIDGVSIKRIKDFYEFAHVMCKLSGGSGCARTIRNIEHNHFEDTLRLHLHKKVRKQERKEKIQQLQDVLLFGGHR